MRLRATVTVRNEAMISARKALGLTQISLAEVAGAPLETVRALENMTYDLLPLSVHAPHPLGDAADTTHQRVERIALALEIDAEDVLPASLEGTGINLTRTVVADVEGARVLEMATGMRTDLLAAAPDCDQDLAAEVRELLATCPSLTARERVVLGARYGLGEAKAETLDFVGRQLHVSRERVRGIEVAALRKLRAWSSRRTTFAIYANRTKALPPPKEGS